MAKGIIGGTIYGCQMLEDLASFVTKFTDVRIQMALQIAPVLPFAGTQRLHPFAALVPVPHVTAVLTSDMISDRSQIYSDNRDLSMDCLGIIPD